MLVSPNGITNVMIAMHRLEPQYVVDKINVVTLSKALIKIHIEAFRNIDGSTFLYFCQPTDCKHTRCPKQILIQNYSVNFKTIPVALIHMHVGQRNFG